MNKELVMIFDGTHWQDIYCRDGTLDRTIVTEDAALAYVRNTYGNRFPGCELVIENGELSVMVPDNIFNKLAPINNA
jgi:hypothetical protein